MNEIITIKQLPIIEERLKVLNAEVTAKVQAALLLECTEDTVKEVKAVRAELNKEAKDLEDKRKAVKKAVLAPYDEFEESYKQYVGNLYKQADQSLKSKIDGVEATLKANREAEITEYFNEYRDSLNIDFVTFADSKIAVTLSASNKSLKEQVKAFLDKIADDLALIDTQECKAEILAEYKTMLNVSKAITTVADRHKRIEEEKQRLQEREEVVQAKASVVEAVETVRMEEEVFSAPAVMATPEPEAKKYEVSFRITDTLDKLKALKEFLTEGGYTYEQF